MNDSFVANVLLKGSTMNIHTQFGPLPEAKIIADLLIAALSNNPPHDIGNYELDHHDIVMRVNHLENVLAASAAYAKAIVADCKWHGAPMYDETRLLESAAKDVTDAMLAAADRILDERADFDG